MAASKTDRLDVLIEECNDLERCSAVLEELYYTCGAIEVAIQYLLQRHNLVGQKFKNLDATVKNWKQCLDGHMKFVRHFNHHAQRGSERLQNLKKAYYPEMVEEINSLGDVLFGYVRDLRQVILQATKTCRGFQVTGRMLLDFLMNQRIEKAKFLH